MNEYVDQDLILSFELAVSSTCMFCSFWCWLFNVFNNTP